MKYRRAAGGFNIIQLLGIMLISLMVSAFGIDFAFYFAAQNHLQTEADSAALAATQQLYSSIAVDPTEKMSEAESTAQDLVASNDPSMMLAGEDVAFGFVDPHTGQYSTSDFRTPSTDPSYSSTGGYNAVYVRVRKSDGSPNGSLDTIMANLLGIHQMNAEAQAIAFIDQSVDTINNGGVRPIYACQAQVNRVMQDGIPENDVVKVYGDHVEVNGVQNEAGCPEMGSGNWGFADLRNCNADAVGSSTISDWFSSGYPGSVSVGQCYSTNPGNFIQSISPQLDTLIANKTVFPVPLYNTWSGGGSTSKVDISGFVGFRITGYKSTGNQSGRYIEGRFQRYICMKGCSSSQGGGTTPGGTVVKIRLAYLH